MLKRFIQGASGSIVYVTIQGDMVDHIAQAYYGSHLGNTERIYDANPNLAKLGHVLDAGVVIKIPPKPAAVSATPFRTLWD